MADPRSAASPPALPVVPDSGYLLRAFLASPAMMAITRLADGVLIDANPAFLEAAALTRDEAVGRPILDLGLWVDPSRRHEYARRLEETGRVQDFEARFQNRAGRLRDMTINAEVIVIDGAPCVVIIALDATDRRQRERERDAVYRISTAALDAPDRTTLFRRVHAIIGEILPARSFFIALYDRATDQVSFPLWNNDQAPDAPPARPLGRSLTDYVLISARPLLLTEAELPEFTRNTGHGPAFGPSQAWLGVPLLQRGEAVGVISLQDYDSPQAYRPEDTTFLAFVAEQLVTALQRVEAEAARRRSEALQRESQAYFVKSFHASPVLQALIRVDNGRIIEVNAAFLAAARYSRDEAIGRTSLELGFWPDPDDRARFMERLLETRSVRDHETVFHTKLREPRQITLNADVFELGGAPCMLITALDLTERKRRERVQDATYRISQAVLAGGDLVTLFAEIHRIVAGLFSARNFYVALVSPDGSLLSFPYFVDETIPPPPARKPGFGLTEYVLHTARPLLTTADELTVILREDSRYMPIGKPAALWLGAPLVIDGRAIGVLVVQDYQNPAAYGEEEKRLLTFVAGQAAVAVQRRQADEALQRAEEQYRGIFENAPEGLYVSTPAGRFLRANPALARMLGYASPAELMSAVNDIGREVYADPGRREEFMHLIRSTDAVTDFESEVVRRDGSRMWLTESVRVIRNAAGEVQRFEGVAIDVTTQREAARALREAKESADAANRAKSQFLASMSHELRTPLNGILGYTQILRRDATLTEKQRAGVGVIHQSADHLLALINDVLDLARIEARKLELHPAEFGLPDFLQSVADFFVPRAREKGLLLETAFAADLPLAVCGDGQRIRQVVFNLISNAIKFTSAGGVVFSAERAGAALRFSVSDSGPGIAPEDLAKLFEPFAQVGELSQRVGGTGLGLNVSRSILEQMGSQLHVESRPGWGSRFWFDLALPEVCDAGPAVPAATAARRIAGYEGPRRRVLLADDHAPNRAVLVDLLAPLGFELAEAENGREALARAAEFRPDLVLMDLRMPLLDGLSATRLLRQGAAAPVVIGVSASAHEEQQRAALAAGCAAFLAKPFRHEDLLAAVGRHLGLAWRHADAPSGETTAPFPALPHAPAPAEADALFELASKGDVMGVRAYAAELAARDPRLAAFSQSVTDLAARFRMKAIRQFVDRYRHPAPPA